MLGCMWLGGGSEEDFSRASTLQAAHAAVDAALENGITRFDHADIYGGGRAERVFGQLLKQRPELVGHIEIQSKCGIRIKDADGPNRYDFSYDWITNSVDGILQRLGIERLDTLLLHRPDPLMEADEVAKAFEQLLSDGKVAQFGVSNMHHHQIKSLQTVLPFTLVANQLEMGLHQVNWVNEGINVGSDHAPNSTYAAGTIEHCVQEGIELQAWSPLSRGQFSGAAADTAPPHIQRTALLVQQMAEKYDSSPEAIILAWLFRHPANISAVIGTTNPERIANCARGTDVELERGDWYALYVSARGSDVP